MGTRCWFSNVLLYLKKIIDVAFRKPFLSLSEQKNEITKNILPNYVLLFMEYDKKRKFQSQLTECSGV